MNKSELRVENFQLKSIFVYESMKHLIGKCFQIPGGESRFEQFDLVESEDV